MKKIFYIILFLQISCTQKPPIQKVAVTNITALTTTMSVTHTRSSGRGAGGAAGGAIAGYLLGGKLTHVVTGGAESVLIVAILFRKDGTLTMQSQLKENKNW